MKEMYKVYCGFPNKYKPTFQKIFQNRQVLW